MTRTEEFEQLRPLLFAIAYRILGSVSEAEDAVQETWLRYETSPTQPTSTKAFLSAVVTRISIDVLRSARFRRETYVGQWLPEPLLTDPYEDPARAAELADSVSMAALLLLERLSPLERAVFVLREVFGFGFPEIASAIGRSEVACRQLAVRARRHMDAGRPRFEADRRVREKLAAQFFEALREGDVDGLRELLAADVSIVGDGGGKAPQWARPILGAEKVARALAAMFPWFVQIGVKLEPHEVNGQPGAIFRDRDDKVLNTWTLEVLDGQIQTIRSVGNPDKLGHVGPVADAWAVCARRTTLAGRHVEFPNSIAAAGSYCQQRFTALRRNCISFSGRKQCVYRVAALGSDKGSLDSTRHPVRKRVQPHGPAHPDRADRRSRRYRDQGRRGAVHHLQLVGGRLQHRPQQGERRQVREGHRSVPGKGSAGRRA